VGKTTVLVGNPNVGKSVLFKNLTRRYVTVSNYPGTTVEVVRAKAAFDGREIEVVDTPGVNDLAPRSDEARVTRKLLDETAGATIVQVADAKNLRRALLLTLQLAELEQPTVLVLNMYDELEERGRQIDTARLSEILGIPVVATVAPQNQGTQELIDALPHAAVPRVPAEVLAPAGDEYGHNRVLLAHANEILGQTYSVARPPHPSVRVRLGLMAMHPVKGLGVLAAILFTVFWFVGLFGAGTLVDLLEVGVFEQRLNPLVIGATDAVLPFPHTHDTEVLTYSFGIPATPVHEVTVGSVEREVVLPAYSLEPAADLSAWRQVLRFGHDFLVGPYGAITMALAYAFAIVLPIVTAFFLVFSILEDSGYFPRMAIMVNRVFRVMGLNGKAVLPMILGLGCDTMATMTTRILETRKERIVTTMLLALAVPCSAQLGVLLALMASLSPAGALVWLGLVIGVIFVVGWLTARVIGGEGSDFILEIPPMRRPQLSNVLVKTASRLDWYLREVIPLFVLGMGFMRRDFGAVYILDAATGPAAVLTPHQILVAMVTITLFMPCIANFLMIAKEHGMKTAVSMAAFIFPFAFFVGGVIHRLGVWLSI
jgi:ferrous iron transport protein B